MKTNNTATLERRWRIRISDCYCEYEYELNARANDVSIHDLYELVRERLRANDVHGRFVDPEEGQRKSVGSRELVSLLSEWEKVAFDREPGFLERFCHNSWQLAKVSWSSETMHVVYIAECGQHITASFPLRDWLEFYEANNEVRNSDPKKP